MDASPPGSPLKPVTLFGGADEDDEGEPLAAKTASKDTLALGLGSLPTASCMCVCTHNMSIIPTPPKQCKWGTMIVETIPILMEVM